MLSARRKALTQIGESTPRDADHPKQKEQGREEKKTHELFHPYHPGPGPDKAEPGGLRAKEQIRRAHPRGDSEEHEKDDRGRLRESEPKRGAEIRRGAGGGENGCETP